MDILQPEYNILRVAGSSFGYKHSDEARSKMSTTKQGLKRSDETRTKISTARQGLKHSDEIRAKMSFIYIYIHIYIYKTCKYIYSC